MIEVGVEAMGLMAPGLAGWRESLPVLRGERPYEETPLPALKPDRLQPNERRRTTQTIKLALVCADDALRQIEPPPELLSVFASTEGDLDIINQICLALTQPDRPVSPTHFHNSVHNAPAGYWSIACGFRQASTSIAAREGAFACGLLEAALQVEEEAKPVLLVAYDIASPEPLRRLIPSDRSLAAALLLHPAASGDPFARTLVRLTLQPAAASDEHALEDHALEQLRLAQPMGRALPLLRALAIGQTGPVLLPYLPGLGLRVELNPC